MLSRFIMVFRGSPTTPTLGSEDKVAVGEPSYTETCRSIVKPREEIRIGDHHPSRNIIVETYTSPHKEGTAAVRLFLGDVPPVRGGPDSVAVYLRGPIPDGLKQHHLGFVRKLKGLIKSGQTNIPLEDIQPDY